jgi:hypothetical protein
MTAQDRYSPEGMRAALERMRDDDGKLPAYAWPGGYPVVYYTENGLTICALCANETDTSDPVIAGEVYWEGPAIVCDDKGETVESAYGDADRGGAA